jgi:hypothetical protein
MKFWKKITCTGGMIWGIKSMLIGFGGLTLMHMYPFLKFFSWLDKLTFWTGIWGICLFTACGILFLVEYNRIHFGRGCKNRTE